ncbi:MAG: hypothetical protein HY815_22615 [Candidatus Riflebacteria bacterium]|nr:hypothetical protein [Candidatus Riflebacteria bacterium]
MADGRRLTTWQIYASPVRAGDRRGPYRFVEATGEGIGCVDDVARAAIVYLRHHQGTGSTKSLASALEALAFVRALRAGDGTYYNFVDAGGTINQTGPTSRKGLNWWTARAFWATAEAIRILGPSSSSAMVAALEVDARRTVGALARHLEGRRGRFETIGSARLPAWLVAGAADVTAVFVLGLAALVEAAPDPVARDLLETFAAGIAACELGSPGRYPYHAHMPSRALMYWHAYGAHMLHALAVAGRVLGRRSLLEAACREADNLSMHLLISGGPIWGFTPPPRAYPQIAYGLSPQVLGLLELDRAADQFAPPAVWRERRGRSRAPVDHGRMAGLMGSWLFGTNPAAEAVFDPLTGRVFDGIDPRGVSLDSGAESTIEGLMTMLELQRHPGLAPLVEAREIARRAPVVFEVEAGACPRSRPASREEFSGGKGLTLAPGSSVTLDAGVDPGAYQLAPVLVRDGGGTGEGLSIETTTRHGARRFEVSLPSASLSWPMAESAPPTEVELDRSSMVTIRLAPTASAAIDLDCIVVQPVVEFRVFAAPSGRVAAVRNLSRSPRSVDLPGRPERTIVPGLASLLIDY